MIPYTVCFVMDYPEFSVKNGKRKDPTKIIGPERINYAFLVVRERLLTACSTFSVSSSALRPMGEMGSP